MSTDENEKGGSTLKGKGRGKGSKGLKGMDPLRAVGRSRTIDAAKHDTAQMLGGSAAADTVDPIGKLSGESHERGRTAVPRIGTAAQPRHAILTSVIFDFPSSMVAFTIRVHVGAFNPVRNESSLRYLCFPFWFQLPCLFFSTSRLCPLSFLHHPLHLMPLSWLFQGHFFVGIHLRRSARFRGGRMLQVQPLPYYSRVSGALQSSCFIPFILISPQIVLVLHQTQSFF